jgi:hypothetical protein
MTWNSLSAAADDLEGLSALDLEVEGGAEAGDAVDVAAGDEVAGLEEEAPDSVDVTAAADDTATADETLGADKDENWEVVDALVAADFAVDGVADGVCAAAGFAAALVPFAPTTRLIKLTGARGPGAYRRSSSSRLRG